MALRSPQTSKGGIHFSSKDIFRCVDPRQQQTARRAVPMVPEVCTGIKDPRTLVQQTAPFDTQKQCLVGPKNVDHGQVRKAFFRTTSVFALGFREERSFSPISSITTSLTPGRTAISGSAKASKAATSTTYFPTVGLPYRTGSFSM